MTTTGFSVAVALLVGTIELMQVLIGMLDLHSRFFDAVAALHFGVLGYLIVGMFLLAWGFSVAVWRFGRIEERYSMRSDAHSHTHTHGGGIEHSHTHLHDTSSKNVNSAQRQLVGAAFGLLIAMGSPNPGVSRADTVASLLGNFTVNQYCGLKLANDFSLGCAVVRGCF